MKPVIAVAVGGAIGSVLRYAVQKRFNVSFPAGTLAVNLVGCFLAGWLLTLTGKDSGSGVQLFLMTGFCGGFTTFSAFSVENIQMMISGKWVTAVFYLFLSIAGGLLATFTSYKIFRS